MLFVAKIFFIFCFSLFSVAASQAAEVSVKGERGRWYLDVGGHPFYIKGAGCGYAFGKNGEDYLRLAKELGANAVRTWGTDQGDRAYLDLAQKYGLKVAAGLWLNWPDKAGRFSYLNDEAYKKSKRKEVLNYINACKKHPAILMWVVGNETIFFTKDERERIAFCDFLECLVRDIHKIDPSHPVAYASAGTADLPYLRKYVPSLDIVGMNVYGSIRSVQDMWDFLKFDKPYVLTEFGSYLSLDRPKDENGGPIELFDQDKAKRYKELAGQLFSFKGDNLGGFVFHLGETTQESMTWWNINEGMDKRPSFWAIYEFFTGKRPLCREPARVKKLLLSKTKDVSPGETIEARVETFNENVDGLRFEFRLSTSKENILEYYVNAYLPVVISGAGPKVLIEAPARKGIYRVYCFIRDARGNVVSCNRTISVK